MKKYLPILNQSKLFKQLSDEDILHALNCLDVKIKAFPRNSNILMPNTVQEDLCLLLEGEVLLIRDDFWGNQHLIGEIKKQEIFAESYALNQQVALPLRALAANKSLVMFINIKKLQTTCGHHCAYHQQLITNLMTILAKKNLMMNEKIRCLSQRSIKEKILTYLENEAKHQNRSAFDIPFNRQQLADFLAIDRSALSRELSNLKKQGLIDYHTNHFIIKD